MKIFKLLVSVFFPNTCVCCGEVIEEGEFFCDYCFEMLNNISWDKLCLKCGNPKKNCRCKNQVFCFDYCIAPFYNNGEAQRAMYSFKLARRKEIGELFARQMALSVKQGFGNVEFDGVCYVPSSIGVRLKRGYNQSEVLARRIAELLNLPLMTDFIKVKSKHKGQHSMSFKQRFENVKGVYFTQGKTRAKTVLLIDDIKTTGATLNECARALKKAGAINVFCVTGLITQKKERK